MSWILGAIYCGAIWLVFAKLKLIRMSLPITVLLSSVGPSLIVALLFCAQYYHPYTDSVIALQDVDPIAAQLTRPGRVTRVAVQPNLPVKKGDILFEVDRVPYQNTVDRMEASLLEAKQSVELAKANVEVAKSSLNRAASDLEYAVNDRDRNAKLKESGGASVQEYEQSLTRYSAAVAASEQSEERLQQATLSVDVANARVDQMATLLQDAKYDLEQTTAVAPHDGFVTNLQLREGMLVGGSGSGGVMTLVRDRDEQQKGIVVATFTEKSYLMIEPGQYTEIALDGYPGQIFTARVINSIDVSGSGQLTASEMLPEEILTGKPTNFAVRIRIDNADSLRLPAGAQGQAAVYTSHMQIAGIPVMFLIRANSWLKYLY